MRFSWQGASASRPAWLPQHPSAPPAALLHPPRRYEGTDEDLYTPGQYEETFGFALCNNTLDSATWERQRERRALQV